MNCYFCNHKILYFITGYIGINKCTTCKKYYIKENELNSFIQMYCLTFFKLDKKYLKNVLHDFSYIINKENNIKVNPIECNNKNCKSNCTFFKYEKNGYTYYKCNQLNYFIFSKDDLYTCLKKLILKNKIKYFFYKIIGKGEKYYV